VDSGNLTPCEVGQQNLLGLVDVDENYLRTVCVCVFSMSNVCCGKRLPSI